jgi:hypothetical protein
MTTARRFHGAMGRSRMSLLVFRPRIRGVRRTAGLLGQVVLQPHLFELSALHLGPISMTLLHLQDL